MKREKVLRAIEYDLDTRIMRDVPSQARVADGWIEIMQAILKMPVTKWDCPTTAAGEFEEAK